MGSQFSLSLELTKLIPFGSLVTTGSQAIVRLVRELQASGSDFITEQDLAEVFGRNRIEPRFESTFRTAVKTSAVHKVADIAELVIESGAGPTVRRSLNEPAYFATVVQLSLLTWTHDLTDLAKALAKSFERRAEGATEYVALPRFDAIKGTLRAYREQTSGFMWELILSAVETKLYGHITWTDGLLYKMRPIPTIVLQALMDAFTAVQHLPENTLLRIKSTQGIPSIIVWAHHVLGLTVRVINTRGQFVFGEGPESVFIEGTNYGIAEATLLNETDDALFHLVRTEEDTYLRPLSSHPLRGYGSRLLEFEIYDEELLQKAIHDVVTECLKMALLNYQGGPQSRRMPQLGRPRLQRLLQICKELFPAHHSTIDLVRPHETDDLFSKRPTAVSDDLDLFQYASNPLSVVLKIAYVIVVLSFVEGLEPQTPLCTDLLCSSSFGSEMYGSQQIFNAMAFLLRGEEVGEGDRLAAVSASGWTLCVSSVVAKDPSDIKSSMTLVPGVPTRRGERKRMILDGFPNRPISVADDTQGPMYIPVAGPGQKCDLRSWTKPRKTRYFIGTTDEAFEVAKIFECEPITANWGFETEQLRLGFLAMQQLCWKVTYLQPCEHSVALGQVATLPPGVVAFHGFDSFEGSEPRETDIFVYAGMVAGDSSARWILLNYMVNEKLTGWSTRICRQIENYWVCLRTRECCFTCALDQARDLKGPHIEDFRTRICLVL
ncbi:MAG: hypothetical protein L6R41_002338 [Letrouitia leprolyta]|nr:MAG: hypothetical protein L6R41_002338 [Letrouitia leprolyta]